MSAQKSRPAGAFGAFLGLIGFSALAGLLVTVMITPALAVTSVGASATINVFNSLPDGLAIGAQPQQNQIYAVRSWNDDGTPNYGNPIATVYNQNREELTWEQLPELFKYATLAAEDIRFYDHGGIDPQGIVRAAVTNASTGSMQGGSTLTQQLVKNVCISEVVKNNPDPTEEDDLLRQAGIKNCQKGSLDRKIKEMKYAISLEKVYTKDEILLAYDNIAGFGGNVYGIQSAAQRYFSKDAGELSLAEVASIMAIVQAPEDRRLDQPENYQRNTDRRNYILNAMLSEGYITQADHDTAINTTVESTVDLDEPRNGCIAANAAAKQFCDFVVESVTELDGLGKNEQEREDNWRVGGYKLYTTLDLKLNKTAQQTLREYAPIKETALQLGASAVSVEPGTGYIRVMAQNKVFDNQGEGDGAGGRPGTSAINFNTDKAHGGSSGFQPGSSYKLFTLLNWLEAGRGLDERVDATPVSTPQSDFLDSCNGPWAGTPYKPRNDSGERGYFTIRNATARSVNGAYVQMALQLDLCETKNIALKLGIRRAAQIPETAPGGFKDFDDLSTNPASILGVDSVAPIAIAGAYAAVANHGEYCKPIAVTSIIDSSGAEKGGQQPSCTPGVDKEVAAAAADALSTGGKSYVSNPQDGTPYFGKTGTTNGSQQTWVTMSSTALATTVWYGNITGDYQIRGYCGGKAQCDGGQQRHKIMRAILAQADKHYKGEAFDPAPERLLHGTNIKVGNFIGLSEADGQAAIEAATLRYSNEGEIGSPLPAGQIAKQVPEEGTPVAEGQTVRVWLSDGTKGIVPDVTTTPTSVDAARAAILAAGFGEPAQTCVVSAISVTDPVTGIATPGVAEGQVLAISPAAGTTLMKTKPITISVAHAVC